MSDQPLRYALRAACFLLDSATRQPSTLDLIHFRAEAARLFWTAACPAAWQAESCEAAKAAAESAVREYAAAILAALPARTVTEPTAEEVEETARALHAMEEKRRRLWRTWDYMDPIAHESYRSIARAAIAAGLDPRRLKEGT